MTPSAEHWRHLSDDEIPVVKVHLPAMRARQAKHYLGPIAESLFARLAPLGGKALAVYLVALQRSRIDGANPIVLTTCYLSRFGLTQREKVRALQHLQCAGVVKVQSRGSRNPLVTLLSEAKRRKRQQP